jgi:hypothetical protein
MFVKPLLNQFPTWIVVHKHLIANNFYLFSQCERTSKLKPYQPHKAHQLFIHIHCWTSLKMKYQIVPWWIKWKLENSPTINNFILMTNNWMGYVLTHVLCTTSFDELQKLMVTRMFLVKWFAYSEVITILQNNIIAPC